MAFGKKKKVESSVAVTQQNVSTLASQALARMRNTQVNLPMRIVGTSPLLMHRFGEKAVIEMLSSMVGNKLPRGNKDLTAEYEASWYRNEKGQLALPLRLIKACIIEGAISTDGVASKAELKRGLRVCGNTALIRTADNAPMRLSRDEHMDIRLVRNNGGSPDVRARALIPAGYHMDVVLQFSPAMLSIDAVVSAFSAAGATIGLCDFRPARGGECGTFEIQPLSETDVPRILKESIVPEEGFTIPEQLLTAFNSIPEDKLTDPARKVKSLIKNGKNVLESEAE